jgi:hypothetical protein
MIMGSVFNDLLDRHLSLSTRVRQPNPEHVRSEIESLVVDISMAIDQETIVGPQARQMMILAGQWQVHLATSQVASKPETTSQDLEVLPLSRVLRGMSTRQAWSVGGGLLALLIGAGAIGRYEAKLELQSKLMTATNEAAAHKSRADGLSSQLDVVTKQHQQSGPLAEALAQERLLLALILKLNDTSRADKPALRTQLQELLKTMQQARRVNTWMDNGILYIEIERTSEVWSVRQP